MTKEKILPLSTVLELIENEPAYPDGEEFMEQMVNTLADHELTAEFVTTLLLMTARASVKDTKQCLIEKINAL